MTDGLMKRLDSLHKQATVERGHFYVGSCVRDAMRRIEDLENALSLRTNLHQECIHLLQSAEAKLAKAINIASLSLDALYEVQTYEQPDDPDSENALTMHELDAFDFHVEKARADIAELKGQDDE